MATSLPVNSAPPITKPTVKPLNKPIEATKDKKNGPPTQNANKRSKRAKNVKT